MSTSRKSWSWLRNRRDVAHDIEDEFATHLQITVDEFIASGLDPDAARAQALRRFGDVAGTQRRCTRIGIREIQNRRRADMLQQMFQDIRFAFRGFVRNPGFAAIALLTIALGIGANAAIFSVVNSVILQPLSFPNADRLVTLWRQNDHPYWAAYPEYFDFRERANTLEAFAVYEPRGTNLTGLGEPRRIDSAAVSADFFEVFGTQPLLGRTFTDNDDVPGARQVVVLQHDFWQAQLGGRRDVIGEEIHLDDKAHTVVGVMPPGFGYPNDDIGLWTPIAIDPTNPGSRSWHNILTVASLEPDASFAQAEQDILRLSDEMERAFPDDYPPQIEWGVTIKSLHESIVGDVRPTLLILLGAVGLVLLIACANVANLMLGRALARETEMAVRAALGAGRFRIIRQLLTESVALCGLGGLLGLGLAALGVSTIIALGPESLPRLREVRIDGLVFAFTAVVAILTGVLFGVIPAWHVLRCDLQKSIRQSGQRAVTAAGHRLRNSLVALEIALSLIVLVGAGLLFQSFRHLEEADPGFQTEHVISFRLALPQSRYAGPVAKIAFHREFIERLETLPGVEAAGGISALPLSMEGGTITFMAEGMPPNFPQYPELDGLLACGWRTVSPGYFQAMGMTLLEGRLIEDDDLNSTVPVVVMGEAFAAAAWPEAESVIGKRICDPPTDGATPQWFTVVGLVKETQQYGYDLPDTMDVFFPFTQLGTPIRYLTLRTTQSPESTIAAVRHELAAIDDMLPIYDVQTMDARFAGTIAQPRFNLLLMGLFAMLAFVLGLVGIYGVMSYTVSQRTRDLGLRMALGATRGNILALVMRHGMTVTLIGIGLGLIGAFALTHLMESLVYGIEPTDPITFGGVALVILLVAAGACYLPARRAARLDPMTTLRYE